MCDLDSKQEKVAKILPNGEFAHNQIHTLGVFLSTKRYSLTIDADFVWKHIFKIEQKIQTN